MQPPPGTDARGEATYLQIIDTLYGSTQDQIAEDARAHTALQEAIATCMKQAGFSYTPPPPPMGFAGGPANPGDLMSLAPVGNGSFAMAQRLRRVAEAAEKTSNPGSEKLTTEADRKAYHGATKECFNVPVPETFRTAGFGELKEDLVSIFTKIESQPQIKNRIATYRGCMKTAGFAVENYSQLYMQVREKFPDTAIGWTALSASPEWAAAVDFEQRAATADATCRSDLRTDAMVAAAPALDRFVATNEEALAKARSSWAQQRTLAHS